MDLRKEEVEEILSLGSEAKQVQGEKLSGEAILLFLEPSTRTRLSFEKACKRLGLEVYSVIGESSSIVKGESLYDTFKTIEALGFRCVIFRFPFVFFPYRQIVDKVRIAFINAGDGTHQHPTQGLIDLFTLKEKLGDIKNLRVLYVGDILHSRVFRSGAPLLKMFGAKVSVCGPKSLIPEDINVFEVEQVFFDLDKALDWADTVIWLRLQKERQEERFIYERSYFRRFGLTAQRYNKLKGFFMHPGPVNREVDIEGDLVYSEKSLVQEQVKNGIYIRTAVLKWCLES